MTCSWALFAARILNSLSSVQFNTNVYGTRSEVEMDEMGNAELQTPTLKPDDPTKSSVSLVIPTQPTPNGSFTPAMPTPLQPAPTPSLIGPSQVKTKPPTPAQSVHLCLCVIRTVL
ncbi:hypothetical protein BLNAU_15748 [Blattamonas nauphoetae]|uniref:Uncharacterized protein n=1 Tax=Blattamonas nauphoetae TaxID=2049346 RepID=A0ABQ9X9P3_9EUKA|nr:hypothetical protein BLNAU_15748 [Blattamonas nauphoetae]